MATHTTTGVNSYVREFTIGRKNGQSDKNGRPYWFEWIKEIPTGREAQDRLFETRTSAKGDRHYEIYSAVDGYIIDAKVEIPSYSNDKVPHFYVVLQDGIDKYSLNFGPLEGRYAMNAMQRFASEYFNPGAKVRLSPYAIEKDGGGWNIGVVIYCGADKLEARRADGDKGGFNPPQAITTKYKGDTLWDFSQVAEYLWAWMQANVVPALVGYSAEPVIGLEKPEISFPATAQKPIVQTGPVDDLPF